MKMLVIISMHLKMNFSKKINLDIERLTKVKSFVTETLDDYSCERSQDEIESYERCEK